MRASAEASFGRMKTCGGLSTLGARSLVEVFGSVSSVFEGVAFVGFLDRVFMLAIDDVGEGRYSAVARERPDLENMMIDAPENSQM